MSELVALATAGLPHHHVWKYIELPKQQQSRKPPIQTHTKDRWIAIRRHRTRCLMNVLAWRATIGRESHAARTCTSKMAVNDAYCNPSVGVWMRFSFSLGAKAVIHTETSWTQTNLTWEKRLFEPKFHKVYTLWTDIRSFCLKFGPDKNGVVIIKSCSRLVLTLFTCPLDRLAVSNFTSFLWCIKYAFFYTRCQGVVGNQVIYNCSVHFLLCIWVPFDKYFSEEQFL